MSDVLEEPAYRVETVKICERAKIDLEQKRQRDAERKMERERKAAALKAGRRR
jgi:hypothetical protein